MCLVCSCHSADMEVREHICELVLLFFHFVSSGDRTKISRLGGKHFYLLSHLNKVIGLDNNTNNHSKTQNKTSVSLIQSWIAWDTLY